jgi:predicted phage tail protein
VHHTATATQFPVGAPQTGGGGTAGLQDVSLFGIGGAAILSGIGTLAYRRRLTRKRRAADNETPSTPTHAGTH